MKMKQISDTTLKITISINDLEERGMQLSDFIVPQERTEEFFYTVLDELDLPEQFRRGGLMSFRIATKSDRVDIFVTQTDMPTELDPDAVHRMDELSRLSPEEFFKGLEEHLGDQTVKEALASQQPTEVEEHLETEDLDYVHYVLAFDHLSEVVMFSKQVAIETEASELYKYQGGYQMTLLFYVADKPKAYPDNVQARLLEHAKVSTMTRAQLREHAILLREGQVFAELAGLKGKA